MSFENATNNESFPLREKYQTMADKYNFLSISAFSITELGRQAKNIASFLDGDGNTNDDTNFGRDLNIKYIGDSGNYSDMKIHIDDLDSFVKAVKDYYGD